jgi:hypothetical protein
VALCSAITVRQDWRCLTTAQRTAVIAVWQQLYTNGVVANLTDIYVRYWQAWHASGEIIPAHRWLAYELESYMQQIDPTVSLPYWVFIECNISLYNYYLNEYLLSVSVDSGRTPGKVYRLGHLWPQWKLFGRVLCGRRHLQRVGSHWSPRGTIYPWASPELDTNLLHFGTLYELYYLAYIGIYYQPLVNIGGYEGQFSHRDAPYESVYALISN